MYENGLSNEVRHYTVMMMRNIEYGQKGNSLSKQTFVQNFK